MDLFIERGFDLIFQYTDFHFNYFILFQEAHDGYEHREYNNSTSTDEEIYVHPSCRIETSQDSAGSSREHRGSGAPLWPGSVGLDPDVEVAYFFRYCPSALLVVFPFLFFTLLLLFTNGFFKVINARRDSEVQPGSPEEIAPTAQAEDNFGISKCCISFISEVLLREFQNH